jgi:hypothetical protein
VVISGRSVTSLPASPACRVCIRPESSNANAYHARPYQHCCRAPSQCVSCLDQQPGWRTKSKNGKNGRSDPQLNENSFARMIGRGRIKASGCFTNSHSGLVNEPVSRERNAESQEEIAPQQETGRGLRLRFSRA